MYKINSETSAVVNATSYVINKNIKLLIGFITTIGFYHGLVIDYRGGSKSKSLQQVFQPSEWYSFLQYKEEILGYFCKRIKIHSNVQISPPTKHCKYCTCASKSKTTMLDMQTEINSGAKTI